MSFLMKLFFPSPNYTPMLGHISGLRSFSYQTQGMRNTETNLLDDPSCTSNHTGENAEENTVLMQQDVPTSQSLTGADSDDDSGDAVPDSVQGSALGSPSVLPHVHAPTTGQ
jgi:hypothetical protein